MLDKRIVTRLPNTPGVYQFLNHRGEILYIGKAKNIKNRIRQHIQSDKRAPIKNKKMLEQVKDITWTETDNELEALILENTLIKQHRPKYNILLRDDKNFLFVKISVHDPYPQISIVRRPNDKKSLYFGPYATAHHIRETLNLIEKIFPYHCLTFFQKGVTHVPCFNYHIHRCPGLCMGAISAEEYRGIIDHIIRFLRGDIDDMITTLQQEMKNYSTQKEFERAAKIRDTLFALQGIAEKQKVVDANQRTDEDVIAYSVIAPVLYVTILKIRGGKLIQQENLTFTLPLNSFPSPSDMVERIVEEYYTMTTDIPRTIILPVDLSNKKSVEAWLSQQAERKVTLLSPEKGKKQYLLHLCQKNVESFAHQEQFKVVSRTGINPEMGIKELAKILGYKKPLHRIECYDISHLAGKFTVASMVVFTDGVPDKKQYRQFKMNMPSGRIDDYQALKETLERRLKYIVNPMMKKMIKDKKESFLQKPDLIVLDGGKGQLSIGVQVLSHLSLLHKIQLLSIAKEEEEIFSPHQQQPITLAKDSQGQYLIERLRDEAHRFANTFHRKLRTKEIKTSRLDSISGMGTVTKKKLITAFGSLKNAQRAEMQDLEKVVGKRLAQEIKEKL